MSKHVDDLEPVLHEVAERQVDDVDPSMQLAPVDDLSIMTTTSTSTSTSTTAAHAQTQARLAVQQTIAASRYNYVDITSLPTLFPAPIAGLITAVATSARLSLRVSAFFIEAILEMSQYSTRLSLGYTRRLLISALSSARQVYLLAGIEGDQLGSLLSLAHHKGSASATPSQSDPTAEGFLQVLDKYTNLGIYFIHHTFTLAELFTMTGFYLTANAIQSAHTAAQESVALLDSLFGSNESSRALSAIISMVRRELLEDERFKEKEKGTIASLTALTKALTAFACLQNATWKMTASKFRMTLLYDCTVLKEKDELAPLAGRRASVPSLSSISNATAGPGPSTLASRSTTGTAVVESDVPTLDLARERSPDLHPSHADDFDQPHEQIDIDDDADDRLRFFSLSPKPPSQRRRGSKARQRDLFEVTEEYRESTEVVRTFEQRDKPGGSSSVAPRHRRFGSEPLMLSHGADLRISSTDQDEDWMEVDQTEHDVAKLPSVPNGVSPSSPERSTKAQLVLRTMTNRLLSRKRIVRRISQDETSDSGRDASDQPARAKTKTASKSMFWGRGKGSTLLKTQAAAAPSRLSASPIIISPARHDSSPDALSVGNPDNRESSNMSGAPTRLAPAMRPLARSRGFLGPHRSRTSRRSRSPSPTVPPPSTSNLFDVDENDAAAQGA